VAQPASNETMMSYKRGKKKKKNYAGSENHSPSY